MLECRIDRVEEEGLSAELLREVDRPWRPEVLVCPALTKNPRMDLLVEKVTEIGVTAIAPFAAERCVVKLGSDRSERRLDRWNRVARAAAEQSGRGDLPTIEEPRTLAGLLERLAGSPILVAGWATGALSVREGLDEAGADSTDTVAIVTGPEGGLTGEEVAALLDAGARMVDLGETVLRAETAGIVAAALVSYEMGGLGGARRA
jgi:16S rRNA (uracil1498-N3)-methyltransferase